MNEPRAPRVLFACPQTLLDVSNGATLQCLSMLRALSAAGLECASFGGGIFDSPSGKARIPNYEAQLEANKGRKVLTVKDVAGSHENPVVHHFFTGFASTVWREMRNGEEGSFLVEYAKVLRRFKPDLVMGYGCDALSRSIWAEARAYGIPTAYVICNGNHRHFHFPLIDVLLTDSETTARRYKELEGLDVDAVGAFIDPRQVIAQTRTPNFVTFVNPTFGKGAGIAARLILTANRERPDIPFLIVETRRRFEESLKAMRAPGGAPGSAFPEATSFENIAVRTASSDVREIYRQTGLLLAPSAAYESFGRVAAEANMNGIPVLASTMGGLPEAVGEGGVLLPVPASMEGPDNLSVLPSEEEIRPWADALYKLWDERTTFAPTALRAAERHAIERSTERLLNVLRPFLEMRAGDAPDFDRKGSVRFDDDPVPETDELRRAARERALTIAAKMKERQAR